MGLVQTAIALLRQAAGHGAHLLRPHVRLAAVAGLHARDPLHVGGEAFGKPRVLLAGVGQRQVGHLVDQHPVRLQLRAARSLPDGHADERVRIGPGLAATHAVAVRGHDAHLEARHREAPVVVRHDVGRAAQPLQERRAVLGESVRVELELHRRAVDRELGAARAGAARPRPGRSRRAPAGAPPRRGGSGQGVGAARGALRTRGLAEQDALGFLGDRGVRC